MVLVAEHEGCVEEGVFRSQRHDREGAEDADVELAEPQRLEVVLLAAHLAAGEDLDVDGAAGALLHQVGELPCRLDHVGLLVEGAREAERDRPLLRRGMRGAERKAGCRGDECAALEDALHRMSSRDPVGAGFRPSLAHMRGGSHRSRM